MKKPILFLLFMLFPVSSWGAEKESPEPFKYVQFEVREWISYGDSDWLKSFDVVGLKGESELKFENIDAPITQLTLRVKPALYWLTLQGSIGFGEIDSGKVTDADRLDGWTFSESESDLDSDIFMADATLFLRLFPWEEKSPSYLDAFIGFSYYREELNITNGEQTINSWLNPVPSGPFAGLDSSYEFRWTSIPVGVKGNLALNKEVTPWLYEFSLNGQAGFGYSSYRGEGIWNLRTDLEQDPSFEHEADGYVLLLNFGINYKPIECFSLGAGYQVQRYRAHNGTDRMFHADGTESELDLEAVNSSRHGPYFLISGQF